MEFDRLQFLSAVDPVGSGALRPDRAADDRLDRLLSELAAAETPADLRRLNDELSEIELDQMLAADTEKFAAFMAEIQAADSPMLAELDAAMAADTERLIILVSEIQPISDG